MKRLVDAFEGLFAAATHLDGETAKTAKFTLENVNWKSTLGKPEPAGHPIVDAHLANACAVSGPQESSTHRVAQALLAVSDQLPWRGSSKDGKDGPDVAIFARNFAVATVIGSGGLLESDNVYAGCSLQASDTYYPPHAHHAEESYWIIGGASDWRVDSRPWFPVRPGDSIYHGSGARHAMQTNDQPLLALWLWTSHLDSEVVIVRD